MKAVGKVVSQDDPIHSTENGDTLGVAQMCVMGTG